MRKKRKLTPQEKARLADKGLGLLDSMLKAMGKRKKRPKGGGGMAGIRPSPCGRCD